jgi:hypothetical protein
LTIKNINVTILLFFNNFIMGYAIIDTETGETTEESGGGQVIIIDDSGKSDDNSNRPQEYDDGSHTPQPELQEHTFEDDNQKERERIAAILDNPFFDPGKLPN